ncbi:MAG: riboflavin kinase [Candidatus Magasanikbacteria bacterium]|nr:riboflavin kinase [Candidatus Magasanikbacteria bacterium]
MFSGMVIKGKGVGKKLGFPTANLDTHKDKINLQTGIYSARFLLNQRKYRGALVFQTEPLTVEVYLIDYKGSDFYGAVLKVNPIQKISEMVVTKTQKQLKEKIKKDIKKIRGFFAS